MNRRQLLSRIYRIATALGLVLLVFLASIVFLNPSSVGNEHFVRNINIWAVVWAINFILVLVLAFILARNLIKLAFEYQTQRPGSRIKSKLVGTFIIFSLFPALIMSSLAFGLINRNLRLWFSSPSQQLLDSSQTITDQYYRLQKKSLQRSVRSLSDRLATEVQALPEEWHELLPREGVHAVRLLDEQGRMVDGWGEWPQEVPAGRRLDTLFSGEGFFFETFRRERPADVDHLVAGVTINGEGGEVRGALLLYSTVPESVAFHAAQVLQAARDYEDLKGGVTQFEVNYFGILALSTLAVVFGFVWLGSYIARKITVPLEALAEGARELAGGNLEHRVEVKAADELGILVSSFNRMAAEIRQSRLKLENANRELRAINERLDERRRYIETILQNVAAGVISVDDSDVIRTANRAALKMLETTPERILNRSLQEVIDEGVYEEYRRLKKRAGLFGAARREITFRRGDRQLHIAATLTPNPVPLKDEAEYLLVLDDLTELIRAEKFAAWQEVARRLAHEIKNPLTPLQLSAERIKKRFARLKASSPSPNGLGEFGQVLFDSMDIIIHEAEMLKNLVEEFSRFARLPVCRPQEVELHGLIERTLALYDGGLARVQIRREFDPLLGRVRVDPEQLQRVFVNLIDNALDALAEVDDRELTIVTRSNERRDSFRVEFQDSGVGMAPGDYERLFLPYFSTKKKGTGLGLAITRQIVSEHNGSIRAEPNHPQGMRFILELPLRPET